jgi:sulfur carrier protein ThiS
MRALLAMLKQKLMVTWMGYALALIFALAIPITNLLTLERAMGRMRFVAMDSRSTFYLTSAGSFESEISIHAELARMAAETIFSRNPDGFDAPERLERLFNPTTAAQLTKEAGRDSDVFRAQAIHEKFESGTIRELSEDSNTALVSVEGQILRTGIFNQKIVNDAKRVTVFLRLTVNDAMNLNGRYPLVVTNYEERFE